MMIGALSYPVLLIDGDCSLCNGASRLILKLERRPELHFAALRSDVAQQLLLLYAQGRPMPDSIVLIDSDGLHVKSRALIRIGRISGGWLVLLRLAAILPQKWADGLYDVVARNRRRWFGTSTYCARVANRHKHRFLDI
ncbi:MAG TPA: DCC1-like thiol-disulfide oxidoreductase family protein [Bacteroidales bacterium]|nr:DCC1-like thiol-disulfide oxidoreductase family protein [Bacteroidales bacterium]